MSKFHKESATSRGISKTLFLITTSVIISLTLLGCKEDEGGIEDEYRFIEQGKQEALADRRALPESFEISPLDEYIFRAQTCAYVMQNNLVSNNWFSWQNTANDEAPAELLARSQQLGIEASDYRLSTFFNNALSEVPNMISQQGNNSSQKFTFFVSTTSDTYAGLKMVLREYTCTAFADGNVWFKESSAQMY